MYKYISGSNCGEKNAKKVNLESTWFVHGLDKLWMNNYWWPTGHQYCVVTLDRATYGKVSMVSIVSSPDLPSIWPCRIRAADTVDTPIPGREWLTGHWYDLPNFHNMYLNVLLTPQSPEHYSLFSLWTLKKCRPEILKCVITARPR